MTRTELRARVSKRALAIAIGLAAGVFSRTEAARQLGKRFKIVDGGIAKDLVILGPGYVLKLGPSEEIKTEVERSRRFRRSPFIAVSIMLTANISAQERGRTFQSLYPGLKPYYEEDLDTLSRGQRDAIRAAKAFGRGRADLHDDHAGNLARFGRATWKWIDLG